MRRYASAGSAVLIVTSMLAGCGGGTVDQRPEIIPPLVIPPGLSAPSTETDASLPAFDGVPPAPVAKRDADLAKPPALPSTASTVAPSTSTAPITRARLDTGASPFISLQDDMDEAWRRVGIALEHSGFAVQDRDRSKGVYRVRYNDRAKRGFWSRTFGKSSSHDYQAVVTATAGGTELRMRDSNGGELAASVATPLLQHLLPALQ